MITLGIFVVPIVVTLRSLALKREDMSFVRRMTCSSSVITVVGATLGNLIKHVDSKTYKDYIFERYRSGVKTNNPDSEFKFDAPVFRKRDIFKGLSSISELSEDHPARKIVEARHLPEDRLSDLYLCESFFKFTNTLIRNKFPSVEGDHPRLIIPFRDEKGEIFAYQGILRCG